MVKKKPKKSLKKKSQKKQKKQLKEEKSELPEVSKELYEIQIRDLNEKLQRLKEQCVELEAENVEVKDNLTQLNEDKADIIAYLKRILKSKTDEIIELKERVIALQQARQIESVEFKEKLDNKELELKTVQAQLTSDVNLLNGKLKVLDEFRIQKDELMKQFQLQEEARKEQDQRHQETLHNIEKSFILKKIHMKKDVEERLIKLSEDFQTIMRHKIDSTTKITIAENSTLKKEMNKLMETCKELIKESNDLKNNQQLLKTKYSLLQAETDEYVKRYLASKAKQKILLEENRTLTTQFNANKDAYEADKKLLQESLSRSEFNLKEQNLINEELKEKLKEQTEKEMTQSRKLEETTIQLVEMELIIKNAVSAIQNVILTQTEADKNNHYRRMAFAQSLLEILKTAKVHDDVQALLITSLRI